jgi:sortase A
MPPKRNDLHFTLHLFILPFILGITYVFILQLRPIVPDQEVSISDEPDIVAAAENVIEYTVGAESKLEPVTKPVPEKPEVPAVKQVVSVKKDVYPDQLYIPSIGLTSKVETVGLDSKRLMVVPEKGLTVGWYKYGTKIGDKGNAVIAGHYDTKEGPTIFYNLSKVNIGDEILVSDSAGTEYTYVVDKTEIFTVAGFPVKEIYGKGGKARLILITCNGSYESETGSYTHRFVAYSELKGKK